MNRQMNANKNKAEHTQMEQTAERTETNCTIKLLLNLNNLKENLFSAMINNEINTYMYKLNQ